MFLHSLYIENFRAIKKARLSLDEAIALIGENDSGRTSLLDALALILNPELSVQDIDFIKEDFYHVIGEDKPAGPLKVDLFFKEKNRGEWRSDEFHSIHKLIDFNPKGKQELRVQFLFYYAEEGISREFTITNTTTNIHCDDIEILEWIRTINPVIRVAPGMLTGHGSVNVLTNVYDSGSNSFPADLQKQVQRVLKSSQSILSKKSLNYYAEIEKGYKAARKLSAYLHTVSGLEGVRFDIKDTNADDDISALSSNAYNERRNISGKIGALLLMATLIKACGKTPLNQVDPIWVIEDPEAHLHKIALATVNKLLRGIQGQKIITTHSGGLLASFPLTQIRKLTRKDGVIYEYKIAEGSLKDDEIRKIDYHLRAHRNSSFFSRVWLLVEGETEFWLLPRFASVLGFDFRLEGISCVEYAQSGLRPLIKVAEQMNIDWLLLSDGDQAGMNYANQAEALNKENSVGKIHVFPARDIEHYLWKSGYKGVYYKSAKTSHPIDKVSPSRTIKQAIRKYSKPHMALNIVEAAAARGAQGVPKELKEIIRLCIKAARSNF